MHLRRKPSGLASVFGALELRVLESLWRRGDASRARSARRLSGRRLHHADDDDGAAAQEGRARAAEERPRVHLPRRSTRARNSSQVSSRGPSSRCCRATARSPSCRVSSTKSAGRTSGCSTSSSASFARSGASRRRDDDVLAPRRDHHARRRSRWSCSARRSLVAALAPIVARRLERYSPASRATLLFRLRDAARRRCAALASLGVALPIFLLYEPRDTEETLPLTSARRRSPGWRSSAAAPCARGRWRGARPATCCAAGASAAAASTDSTRRSRSTRSTSRSRPSRSSA